MIDNGRRASPGGSVEETGGPDFGITPATKVLSELTGLSTNSLNVSIFGKPP
jgi:hypothetical protein